MKNGNLQNFNHLDLLLANNSPLIKKTILKAIMKQTRLKNKFIKYRC